MTQLIAQSWIAFDSREASLETVGGKGANLARLTQAGFCVPPGFIILTSAYQSYVLANNLGTAINAALENLSAEDPSALEQASAQIRQAFLAGKISESMATSISSAYAQFSHKPVAVRSSATAEDLPDLSFAGQQDTYLNILGETQLFDAIIRCWASLWTARAIGYRARNAIRHNDTALAVIVQAMIQSDVSGVLFTANPLTGLRSETVIDATFGLGEALVSGLVEPDHYTVNSQTGLIKDKSLGAKQLATRGKPGGGVETISENGEMRETLTAAQVMELTATGQRIQAENQTPQDIEWALADQKLYILQARAITSLFPIPTIAFDPLTLWFSFGSVQGVVGPMTPLGRDILQHFVTSAGIRKLFGLKNQSAGGGIMAEAGERLWIKISDVIRNPIGNRLFGSLIKFIDPSIGQILAALAADPSMGAGQGKLKFSTLKRLARFFMPIAARMVYTILRPEQARANLDARIEDRLQDSRIPAGADRFERLAHFTDFVQDEGQVVNSLPMLLPHFIPVIGPTIGLLRLLTHLSGDTALAMEVLRAIPKNVTTEMDLALWDVAAAIRADQPSADLFRNQEAQALAALYLAGDLPTRAQSGIARFMEQYGMRGIGEIDFGQPRWREEPAPVMHTLKSYLEIDPNLAPDIQFARSEQAAHAAIEKMAAHVRQQRGGWLKEKLIRGSARRIRLLMGLRESPKFLAIRIMGIARRALLESGGAFAESGTIEHPQDLVFLRISELEALSRKENQDWKTLIAERRAVYGRELRRTQVPRVLASDGRTFFEGLGAQSDTGEWISGSPVSAGVVEGIVHVVYDPRETRIAPGEILVCPGTDPAWTPLFLTAAGLITEVGGMMTHGSVVAREYGIPAVVGVHQATQRLKTGQRVRVDGTAGRIVIL